MRVSLLALALMGSALPAFADEVNVYSHRQPELIQPLIDAFTAETGIVVNVAFVEKGMVERLEAEAANVATQAVADGGRGNLAELGQPFRIEGFYVGIDQIAGGPFARRDDIKHE